MRIDVKMVEVVNLQQLKTDLKIGVWTRETGIDREEQALSFS